MTLAMTLALPLGLPWIAAVLLAMLDGRRRWVGAAAVAILVGCLAALIRLGVAVVADGTVEMVPGAWTPGVGIRLRADLLGVVFAFVSIAVLAVSLLFEWARGIRWRSLPALVVFLAAGLTGIFLTGDAFNFYVFFELSMTASFVLAAYGGARRQLRSAMTFTIVNLVGSLFFLIAVASLYHTSGTLDIHQIATRADRIPPIALIATATFLLVSFGLKLGLFPFHFWVPPVYRDSAPAVAAMLAGAVANIGSYGLLRFGVEMLPDALGTGRTVLLVLGAASVLYGGVLAASRRVTSEVLAYSSIGQAGYILVALGLGGVAGYAAAIIYAVVNAINKTTLFLALPLRGTLVPSAFAIGALSVVGFPLSVGFFGKVALFKAAVVGDGGWVLTLVILGGALSLIYMMRAYQREQWVERAIGRDSPRFARTIVATLAVVSLAFGVWPQPLLALGTQAALALMAQ